MGILKGWIGEKKSAFCIWLTLDKNTYKRFHNTIFPSSNGTSQVDHIIVSIYGIFIVETKNKGGWIFGSEDQRNWTQVFYKKKYSFQNPLRQAYRQKKVLSKFLGLKESHINTIVYFVGGCRFKTKLPENVIKSGLSRYIKSFKQEVLSPVEVEGIFRKIESLKIESKISSRDHVRSLRERHGSKTICPKCGSCLKERVAKSGARAGSKFLGCEKYPSCRFTKSL